MARLKAGAGAPVKRPGIDLTLPNVARLYVDPPAHSIDLYFRREAAFAETWR
jgi:hypothetical protein